MSKRPKEDIWIECERGRFDKFRSIEVVTDIFGEAQCTFEVADDRAWRTLYPLLAPGKTFRVYASGLLVFTGRVDCNELPTTVDEGTIVQVILRTRMADARMGSADASLSLANTSIKDFIVKLFARHGFTSADFLFTPETDRDVVTGKKGSKAPPIDLEPLKADQAKVQPTESTFEAAKRQLDRHHLMIWETATGLIAVGLPSDTQPPFYRFTQRDGVCNFRGARPVRDWAEVPSSIHVFGGGVGKDILRFPAHGVARDADVSAVAAAGPEFRRRVNLSIEGAKDQARAQLSAKREMMARSRRKAAWTIEVDDWSQWDGARALPYAINTTADVDVETHEGTDLRGIFLMTSVRKSFTVDDGTRASLTMIAKGLIDPAG